jgi:hypothetical protein
MGHNMCVPFQPNEVGVFSRNDKGQLMAYEETTFSSMDLVVSANFSLMFNALATLFIIRLMYFHHALDFWKDFKIWLLTIILMMPVLMHIIACSKVFYLSETYECS